MRRGERQNDRVPGNDVFGQEPVSRSALPRWVDAGTFPAPIEPFPKVAVWRAEDAAASRVTHGDVPPEAAQADAQVAA
jgi:hypothetical protein